MLRLAMGAFDFEFFGLFVVQGRTALFYAYQQQSLKMAKALFDLGQKSLFIFAAFLDFPHVLFVLTENQPISRNKRQLNSQKQTKQVSMPCVAP